MKITKSQLKQIIKEELESAMSHNAEVFKDNMDYLMDFGARLKKFRETPDDAPNAGPYLKEFYRQILGEVDSLVNHFNNEGRAASSGQGEFTLSMTLNDEMTSQIEQIQKNLRNPNLPSDQSKRKDLYSAYYTRVLFPIQQFYKRMSKERDVREGKK
tara:strand:+ start:132 stop:602 length:471 start_codon:yes stop_codon:yes gene_type:complete